jgi:hypothetical protein
MTLVVRAFMAFGDRGKQIWHGSRARYLPGRIIMEWTTPQHEEVELNCEISAYASAEL